MGPEIRPSLLYLTYEYPVLTQTFTVNEVRALARAGTPLEVFACRPSREPDPEAREGIRVLTAPPPFSRACVAALAGWLFRRPASLLGLIGLVASARYRDQRLRGWLRGFLALLWGAWLAAELRRRRIAPHLHAQFVDAASTVALCAARLAGTSFSMTNHTAYNPYLLVPKLASAAAVFSISEFDRRLLLRMGRGTGRARIRVLYQGVDLAGLRFQPRPSGSRSGPLRLLSVAALRPKKGHDVLLRALAILREEGVDAELTIVGEGPERPRLEALVEGEGLAGRVRLAGAEPPARVRERLREADLFVLACVVADNGDLDGIPISLMEAMAVGVPVVSTRLSGIPELIRDGVEGHLARPGDPADLAGRIRAALAAGAGGSAVRAARARIERRHDLAACGAALAARLSSLPSGRAPAAASGDGPESDPARRPARLRIGVNGLSVVPGRVGGGETYLSNLVAALRDRLAAGESLVVYGTAAARSLFPASPGGIRFVPVVGGAGPKGLRVAAEHFLLPVRLAADGVDVLLSPGNALPPLAGVRHVLALQSMHYRFVAHQMSPWRVRYFRVMVPLSAGRAARVLTMSRDLARTLDEVAPAARGKTRVVYEGADLAAFGPEGERAAGGPYLLYVSSLNPFKRPDSLVRALARLRGDGFEPPPARLCGRPDPPDRARVEALARELGVADLVRVEGVVEHRRLAPLYRGAAALVYPSAVETFGLPPLEAMACGCPVVASNRTAVPEIVGNGALVVDPDDVGALADAIRRLLTDSALRRDLVARGFANLRRFDWAVTAEETLAALRAAAR